MPEGDSIHKIQRAIVDLVGQRIDRATTQGLERSIAGRTITAIEAHGKHLMIDLDDGTQIRAHLGMYGRFRRFARATGETELRERSPGKITLALYLPTAVLAWIGAKTIEISARRDPRRGMAVATLGPDVIAQDFDPAAAADRAAAHPDRPLFDVLLDQRITAGIGNVYKSELCFLHRLDPRTHLARISRETLTALFTDAMRLLRINVAIGGPRVTVLGPSRAGPDDDRYFVYGRTNKPCKRCETPIACAQLGDPPRWTWWCPQCQP